MLALCLCREIVCRFCVLKASTNEKECLHRKQGGIFSNKGTITWTDGVSNAIMQILVLD